MESLVTALAQGINPTLANIVLVVLCSGFFHVYVMLIRIQASVQYMREKLAGIEEEKREEKMLAAWQRPPYSVAVAKKQTGG